MSPLAIGIHVSKGGAGDISEALWHYTRSLDITAAQIFVMGPQSLRPAHIAEPRVREWALARELFAHSNYISNIWCTDADYAADREGKPRRFLGAKLAEWDTCRRIGARGLVVHIHGVPIETVRDTLRRVAHAIRERRADAATGGVAERSTSSALPIAEPSTEPSTEPFEIVFTDFEGVTRGPTPRPPPEVARANRSSSSR